MGFPFQGVPLPSQGLFPQPLIGRVRFGTPRAGRHPSRGGRAFPRICGESLTASSRRPAEIPCVSLETNPHFPAIAVAPPGARTCMMAKPGASFGNMEFPKNSINIDKFTGFFDKLSGYFRELFSLEMTPRNPGAGRFCHERPAPPCRQTRGIARSCGGEGRKFRESAVLS